MRKLLMEEVAQFKMFTNDFVNIKEVREKQVFQKLYFNRM